MTDQTTEIRFQCRHIHTNGHRCQSPSLRKEDFCYFHHQNRKPIPKAELDARATRQARRAAFSLPRPEDRSAIQAAIGEILLRLAANQLDPRRAGLLLYGLQIASINLPPRQPALDPAETVDEVVNHPEHGLIALPQDFSERISHEKTLEQILMEDWAHQRALEAEEAANQATEINEDDDSILDTLQAVADVSPRPHQLPHSCAVSSRKGWGAVACFGCPILSASSKGWGIGRSPAAFPSQPQPPGTPFIPAPSG